MIVGMAVVFEVQQLFLASEVIVQHRSRGAALSAQLLSTAALHSTGLKAAALRALAINPLERKYILSFECCAFSVQNRFRSTAEPVDASPGNGRSLMRSQPVSPSAMRNWVGTSRTPPNARAINTLRV